MMMSTTHLKLNLNEFLKDVSIKKQYPQKLKKQAFLLDKLFHENYKLINQKLLKTNASGLIHDNVIMYIIDITFTKSNTFLHITDSAGKLLFYSSAGHLQHKGKNKKFRANVLKSFYHILTTKVQFLTDKPVALHLKNVGSSKFWIVDKLKTAFFIKMVKSFNLFPFNGCRSKKARRKK